MQKENLAQPCMLAASYTTLKWKFLLYSLDNVKHYLYTVQDHMHNSRPTVELWHQ